MPLRKLSRKQKALHFKPWYTKGINISIRTEKSLKKESLRLKSEDSVKRYKKYRNTLTRVKTLAYDLYHSKKSTITKTIKRKFGKRLTKFYIGRNQREIKLL